LRACGQGNVKRYEAQEHGAARGCCCCGAGLPSTYRTQTSAPLPPSFTHHGLLIPRPRSICIPPSGHGQAPYGELRATLLYSSHPRSTWCGGVSRSMLPQTLADMCPARRLECVYKPELAGGWVCRGRKRRSDLLRTRWALCWARYRKIGTSFPTKNRHFH